MDIYLCFGGDLDFAIWKNVWDSSPGDDGGVAIPIGKIYTVLWKGAPRPALKLWHVGENGKITPRLLKEWSSTLE